MFVNIRFVCPLPTSPISPGIGQSRLTTAYIHKLNETGYFWPEMVYYVPACISGERVPLGRAIVKLGNKWGKVL